MAPPDDHAEAVVEATSTIWTWRIRAAIAFTLVALVATARADGEVRDTRAVLAAQLADEAAAIDRATAAVTEKLATIDTARSRRLAAAYRLLDPPPSASNRIAGSGDRSTGRMAAARRLAASRTLLANDLAERRLLVEEATLLHAAAKRTAGDAAKIGELELPTSIAKPARGTITRKFGTLAHEKSKTTLARRGIELEVDTHAPVSAPADGVVRFAGPIRGLGSGVILDHGAYFTVVAKLGELVVPVGASVARGDRIGRAARHRVYLEVRVKVGPGGRTIDPEPLLARERR